MQDFFIITAKGNGSWLRQKFSPSSWQRAIGEGLIGDYKEKMKILRDVDDQISTWAAELGEWVNKASNAVKNNRIVDAATCLWEINRRFRLISAEGKKVVEVQENALREFESDNKLDIPEEAISAKAGLIDDWKRRWVSNRLKSKLTAKNLAALKGLIDLAAATVGVLNKELELAGVARDHGKIGEYVNVLGRISLLQNRFETKYLVVYETYLKPLMDEVKAKKQREADAIKERDQAELDQIAKDDLAKDQAVKDLKNQAVPKTVPGVPLHVPQFQGPPTVDEPVPLTEDDELAPRAIRTRDRTQRSEEIKNVPIPKIPKEVNSVEPKTVSELSDSEPRTNRSPSLKPEPMKPELVPPSPKPVSSPKPEMIPAKFYEKKPINLEQVKFENKPVNASQQSVSEVLISINNQKFITELVSLSSNPPMMAVAMLKYSEYLEDLDPNKSRKLLLLAKDILGDG